MTAAAAEWAIAAHHEAGHAAIYCRLHWRVISVRIYEVNGEVLGSVRAPPGRYTCIGKALACIYGPLAEERHSGVAFSELARTHCRSDVAMAKNALARKGAFELDRLVLLARVTVVADWQRIELIAAALFEHHRLDYDEVCSLLRGEKTSSASGGYK
jgi:hypothetical protein